MKQPPPGMLVAMITLAVVVVFGGALSAIQPQGRDQACREVVEAQRVLINAQERMIDTLQRQLDDCNGARPPIDPPFRPPPIDPPGSRPPIFPPDDPLTCEELRERVTRDIERGDDGYLRVVNTRETWTTHQVPTTSPGNEVHVSFHGDPNFPAGGSEHFLSVGAYRSAGLLHGNRGATYDGFIVMPNATEPGLVFRDGIDQFGKEKWGFMSYDDEDTRWINAWLNGGGTNNGVAATKEHSYYGKVVGNVEYGWMLIEDWGGQGVQIVSRPWDQDLENDPWIDGDFIWFHDLCLHENGRNLGRASFPLTVAFNRQTDASDVDEHGRPRSHTANVLIERIHIRSTEYGEDTWANGNQIHAKGGILVRGSDADPNGWTFGGVFVSDVILALTDSDRALMQFRNIEDLTVTRIDAEDATGNRRVDLHAVGVLHWTGNDTMNGVTVRYCNRPGAEQSGHVHNWISSEDGTETFEMINGVRQVDGR